ncbi:VOC family protein [uncultured Shewanella sp.]|uniref:VOC family protein n=1 Tax=uncultured Shewanella sp. TaxID=173975 RepID=UPI00262B2B61|nr:VOC family protein [uncultured Shewanella sp.]
MGNFEFRGINHLALVCRDMKKTITFYRDILGMPLTKTVTLPSGHGQHFFFDCGGGDQLAFFWFSDAPESQPGVTTAKNLVTKGDITTAHGSMNHVAFDVPLERMDDYKQRLKQAGLECTDVYHDDSEQGIGQELNKSTFIRSIYFKDPDGILLELASWTRELTLEDVNVEPMNLED